MSTSCTLEDGTVIDLSTASEQEAHRCVTRVGSVLRLTEDEEPPPFLYPRVTPMKHETTDEQATTEHEVETSPLVPGAAPEPEPDLTSTVGVPESPSPADLGALMQSAGGGVLGLVVVVVAVLGGTQGFKLWTKIAEQRHERELKRLEIEQANAGLGGAQPPPCQTAHQALVAEINALKGGLTEHHGRISRVEKATAGFDPGVDVADLDSRVDAIEKSLRKKTRTGGEA